MTYGKILSEVLANFPQEIHSAYETISRLVSSYKDTGARKSGSRWPTTTKKKEKLIILEILFSNLISI